ncbi:WD40 repeat domain-containing protein [Sphingomonas sp. 3F27E9-B]|uniref:WD40 repeat domain-containing protein n=1 Tax=unclassified Sphingomonas TaxID=196159 RepID=UPI002F41A6A3
MSILTGSSSTMTSAVSTIAYDSKAVRTAKAQFTTAATVAPWKSSDALPVNASQVAAITALRSIITPATTDGNGTFLPKDVQTSFTAYQALDKLRVLAETASAKTTSDAQRAQLQKTFLKGLDDLQSYLGTAPSDLVKLAYGKPSSSVTSNKLAATNVYETEGKGLVKIRSDAIPGLTGTEQFSITLSKPGTAAQTVTIDLAQGAQPPTLDSVAAQFNAAIASIPNLNTNGTPQLDANGNVVPRWKSTFKVTNEGGKWGFTLSNPTGIEQVTLDQTNAKDALVVATGQTALDAPSSTQLFRFDDPAGDNTRVAMGTIQALDRQATAQNVAAGKTITTTSTTTDLDGKVKTVKTSTSNVYANTDAAAVVTDAQGNSYIVGTTKGDLGANLSDGDNNLFLTKVDGAGNVVWQRGLGATGSSTGAAVSLGPDGSIVVAGTVTGSFGGASTDGDMVVAKYAANGDEKFSTVIRSAGTDVAKAVAVGADGSVYVGGRIAAGNDGFVARIDASGKIAERRTLAGPGSDSVNALAIDDDGNVLALVSHDGNAELRKLQGSSLATDMGSLSLGTADARVIAIADDGTIAVGGATSTALSGAQVNGISGNRDGFVTRIDAGLANASTTYLGSSADDQVDSIAFMNGELYAGGRTTGDLAAPRRGPTDGFVARIDTATGAVQNTTQFGQALLRTEPVRIAADTGGASAVSALGYGRGTINAVASSKVTTQTGLKAGDYFSFKADDGAVRKLTVLADDTLQSIATRMQGMLGASKATVTATAVDGVQQLRITMKSGHQLQLLAGTGDSDALAKLGMEPQRISSPAPVSSNAPKVRPGGSFGLDLGEGLSLSTADMAKTALGKIKDAISMSQTAYRSLYWDDTKAKMVDGSKKNSATGTESTAIVNAQLANYQAALARLTSSTPSTYGF